MSVVAVPRQRRRLRLGVSLPPVIVAIGALIGWELVVEIFNIQRFLLPKPSAIWLSLTGDWRTIATAAQKTGWVAISGLTVGVAAALAAAMLVTRFRRLASGVTTMASALAATPIVALAPVYFKWFGQVGPTAKQAVVVSVVLFPVFAATARGLLQIDPVHAELMRSYAAGEWRLLREVRVPNATPFFLTSLKVAASLSVIAAIVSEYFGGEQGTLGGIITQSAGLSRYDRAWAAVAAACALGLALYAFTNLLERLALRWHPALRAVR
ncbi:MAG TPA: ABC transporter permease subunit [Egibacteraceae bacterium]|nr:ABC transporter permease subunit [Egibacteraceae bacterium]